MSVIPARPVLPSEHDSNAPNSSVDTGLYDAFVSYSRKDSAFALELIEALEGRQRKTWIDRQGIEPSLKWLDIILDAIDRSRCFILVMSPDSLQSRFVNLEIARALEGGKHLVVVLYRDVEGIDTPEEIQETQYINATTLPNEKELVGQILAAMDIDSDWIEFHTSLLVRAIDWSRRNRSTDLLLIGSDLTDAAKNIAVPPSSEPSVTRLQRDYVDSSIRWRFKRRMRSAAIVTAVTAVVLGLSVFGVNTWRKGIAQSLSAAAIGASETPGPAKGYGDRGLLLAAAAVTLDESTSTIRALLHAIQKQPQLNSYLHGHAAELLTSGFHPDSRYAYSVDVDGHYFVWNTMDTSVPAKSGSLGSQTWSKANRNSSGSMLALGSFEGAVAVCSVLTDDLNCKQLDMQNEPITALALSEDGSLLFTGNGKGELFRFDLNTSVKSEYDALDSPVHALRPDTSRALLAIGTESGLVTITSSDFVDQPFRIIGDHGVAVWSVIFIASGNRLASSDGNGGVYLWLLEGSPTEPVKLVEQGGTVLNLQENGDLLLASHANGQMGFWRLDGGDRSYNSLRAEGEPPVRSLTLFDQGSRLIGFSMDGRISEWLIEGKNSRSRVLGQLDSPRFDLNAKLALSRDHEQLLLGDRQHHVVLWDLEQFSTIAQSNSLMTSTPRGASVDLKEAVAYIFDWHQAGLWRLDDGKWKFQRFVAQGTISDVAVANDNKRHAVVYSKGDVVLYDVDVDPPEERSISHNTDPLTVALSPDGNRIALGSGTTSELALFDLKSSVATWKTSYAHASSPTTMSFSSTGEQFASADSNGNVFLWDTGQFPEGPIPLLGHEFGLTTLAFFDQDKKILSTDYDGNAFVWKIDGKSVAITNNYKHSRAIVTASASVESGLVATADIEGVVRLWDIQEESVLGILSYGMARDDNNNELGPVELDFSGNGEELVAVLRDGRLIRWNLSSESLIEIACRMANRAIKKVDLVKTQPTVFFTIDPCAA